MKFSDLGLPKEKEHLDNMFFLWINIMIPITSSHPEFIFKINSGLRTIEYNQKIGGAPTSQHLTGKAVDFTTNNIENNKIIFEYIKKNLNYDQLIDEMNYKWIHVSYDVYKNRKQVLHINK